MSTHRPADHRPPHAHLVQLDVAWEDPTRNHDRVRQLLDKADVRPGDLVLLPEMFATGFSFNIERTNDKAGATMSFFVELADDLQAIVQGGRTVASCHSCAARNVMSMVAPGGRMLCEYAKIHLFSPGGEQEKFEPGRDVLTYEWGATSDQRHATSKPSQVADRVSPVASLRVQPAICYDLRFPELFRAGLKAGAELIALGACWPSVRQHHWRSLLIARAIENQCFVLGCNRVGDDPPKMDTFPGLHYAGGSIAVGPQGDVLGELDDKPGVLSVPLDPAEVRGWRDKFGAWKDRRL